MRIIFCHYFSIDVGSETCVVFILHSCGYRLLALTPKLLTKPIGMPLNFNVTYPFGMSGLSVSDSFLRYSVACSISSSTDGNACMSMHLLMARECDGFVFPPFIVASEVPNLIMLNLSDR